jgi:ribose 5-phosphate isomerase A
MTIYEKALELVPDGCAIGLGSGRAAWAFVELLGERIRAGRLRVRGVPTSEETARIATQHGVPLIGLNEVSELFLTVDGADEVDPNLDLIKGYGRALVREKIVAASSRQLVILVGDEKLVPQLGTRGRLPIEIVPFALPLCLRLLDDLALKPILWEILWEQNNQPALSDNDNYILDCTIDPIADAGRLERSILNIPGVVDTGLFLNMAQIVLVGNRTDFNLIEERRRG